MSQYVHLIGSEDVERAGRNIAEAAQEMTRAFNNLDDALHRHHNFMTEWLQDFNRILQENKGQ